GPGYCRYLPDAPPWLEQGPPRETQQQTILLRPRRCTCRDAACTLLWHGTGARLSSDQSVRVEPEPQHSPQGQSLLPLRFWLRCLPSGPLATGFPVIVSIVAFGYG